MKINTHTKPPKTKTPKLLKALIAILIVLMSSVFFTAAFCCIYYTHQIREAILILLLYLLLALICLTRYSDMSRAYVEITGNAIIAVDYYCFVRKEKRFSFWDIRGAEIRTGRSIHFCGYAYYHFSYIIFRGKNNRYLFKVRSLDESWRVFEKYLDMDEIS